MQDKQTSGEYWNEFVRGLVAEEGEQYELLMLNCGYKTRISARKNGATSFTELSPKDGLKGLITWWASSHNVTKEEITKTLEPVARALVAAIMQQLVQHFNKNKLPTTASLNEKLKDIALSELEKAYPDAIISAESGRGTLRQVIATPFVNLLNNHLLQCPEDEELKQVNNRRIITYLHKNSEKTATSTTTVAPQLKLNTPSSSEVTKTAPLSPQKDGGTTSSFVKKYTNWDGRPAGAGSPKQSENALWLAKKETREWKHMICSDKEYNSMLNIIKKSTKELEDSITQDGSFDLEHNTDKRMKEINFSHQ